MAVKGKSINDFRQYYRRTVISHIMLSHVILTIAVSAALVATGLVQWTNPLFWIITMLTPSVGFVTVAVVLPACIGPMNNILAILMHRTGEPTTLTPPSPNAKNHAKTGLSAVIQAMQSTESSPTKTPTTSRVEKILTEALNHTSCGVILLDSNKNIMSANRAAPIAKNQDGSPIIALDFLDDIDLMTWIDERDNESINAERRWKRVSTDPRLVKTQRIFDVIASYEKGASTETVVILIDQSELYMPEEEDLNFIAFAAHELRGPITVIRGYLDVLGSELSDRLQGDEAELLSRLTVSANRLSGYVNNILNVARFDRHHLQVHLHEDTVAHIYASIADDMSMRATSQHRLLTIDIPDTLPTVAADRSSISEVLGNLLDNAIKYSFEGGLITLRAAQKGDFVEIAITDNGVGMPANVVKNLFHKFYRSHRSREAVAGTGIGLYICKAFVQSHGGTISVVSRENEGSTFTFTLPIYATVADKLLEDKQLNDGLIRQRSGWIKNHAMYRG